MGSMQQSVLDTLDLDSLTDSLSSLGLRDVAAAQIRVEPLAETRAHIQETLESENYFERNAGMLLGRLMTECHNLQERRAYLAKIENAFFAAMNTLIAQAQAIMPLFSFSQDVDLMTHCGTESSENEILHDEEMTVANIIKIAEEIDRVLQEAISSCSTSSSASSTDIATDAAIEEAIEDEKVGSYQRSRKREREIMVFANDDSDNDEEREDGFELTNSSQLVEIKPFDQGNSTALQQSAAKVRRTHQQDGHFENRYHFLNSKKAVDIAVKPVNAGFSIKL